jgi:hypothetical protein
VYRSGAIKIASLNDDTTQVVNGQRLKHYITGDSYNEDVDVIQTVSPEEFIQDNMCRGNLGIVAMGWLIGGA